MNKKSRLLWTTNKKKKSGFDILPTGTCFEDCTLKFAELVKANPSKPNLYLVHGILTMPVTDKPYSHAWIELDGRAIESGINSATGEKLAVVRPVEVFHRENRVQDFTRYSLSDLIALCANGRGSETPPWEEKYRRLTKDRNRS